MKIITKIYCWLKGHDWIVEGIIDNGRSKFGGYRCIRCNREHQWQYDYEV